MKYKHIIFDFGNVLAKFNEQAIIENFSSSKEFDGSIYSGHLKLIKPDPEIYRHLFKTFSLNPKECLFLDDKEKNVQAAQKLGMDAIVFTGDTEPVRALLSLADKGLVH